MEGLERLHQRFLDEILRLGAIAHEPHRVTEQPVDVRHRFRFEREPAAIGVGVGVHRLSTADVQDRPSRPSWPLIAAAARDGHDTPRVLGPEAPDADTGSFMLAAHTDTISIRHHFIPSRRQRRRDGHESTRFRARV